MLREVVLVLHAVSVSTCIWPGRLFLCGFICSLVIPNSRCYYCGGDLEAARWMDLSDL